MEKNYSIITNGFINSELQDEDYLFDPTIILKLDWNYKKSNYKNNISPSNPGENFILRPLSSNDFDKGYMKLLSQLTNIGEVSKIDFSKRFFEMKSCPQTYYIIVIEDKTTGQIIGTASLVLELKFIHSATNRGRIEDVVVDENYRGFQLGKLLVETLTILSKQCGTYKVSLDCKEHNIPFYKGLGYDIEGQSFMVQRFKD